ncbi:sperm-associated antigen 4 protein isoform X4 [Manis javanica]|uniref:sperm-associated antigen 4 protein isoform X4 n=1 Tax=Manis javanica TaxID=9974 RepID=UPI003C6D28CC
MRRSPRPGSATSSQKHTPNFYSDNSMNVTSEDSSSGHRSSGPEPGEREGRKARGRSCGEPFLSAGVPGGTTRPRSSRQKPMPRSHNALTSWGAETQPAGSPVVSEEQLDLHSTLDRRQEIPPPRLSKSFLSRLFQVLSVLFSLVGDVLVIAYREVCSIRFLLTAVSLLSLFLAALWWGLLYLVPPLENEPEEMLTLREYHKRVRSQSQQLQQLQGELDTLHKQVSGIRTANSERVAKLVFQKLNEDFVRKPDYALSSLGASIDLDKTSHDYEDVNTAYFWNRFSFWNYARPPTVILEGLQVDDETEVFLGKFTFYVEKSEIQIFHLQNDPPAAFPKVKIQILSNWGHPRFTCLYRVRAHGLQTSEGEGDSATQGPH